MSCLSARIDHVRAVCRECGEAGAKGVAEAGAGVAPSDMQAFCVRDTSNIFYLTQFDDVFDEEDAHALLVDVAGGADGRVVLHTDSRYADACERASATTGIEVSTQRISHAKFAVAFARSVCSVGVSDASAPADCTASLGIENTISLAEYRAFQEACVAEDAQSAQDALPVFLIETDGIVSGLRAVKDASELTRLRRAQEIADAAFSHIIEFIQPGMTERDVQLELEVYMRRHGAIGVSFPSIVAAGAHGADPHAIATDTPLEVGQCVVLDFGARAEGYCSDITRTVFLGEPDSEMRAAYETIRRANEEVEALLAPGIIGADAHALAERILEEGGFGGKMGHGLGHGVGIDIHEEPVLSPRNVRPLVPGNVVTVEPGIYLPGEFGMRLEDIGVVTGSGFDVFTTSPHDLIVL